MTRPREQAHELAARLEGAGHHVVVCPLIAVEPIGHDPLEVAGYDWVVVTSPNGARQLLRRRRGPLPRVAAVGPGTALALAEGGVRADLVPRVSTQEGLLAELPCPTGRVLFGGGEDARRVLIEAPRADFVPLYRTRAVRPRVFPDADLVVLASASAARSFAALAVDIPAVSIGPETSRAARAAGVRVVAEAATHDVDGLVAAVGRAE